MTCTAQNCLGDDKTRKVWEIGTEGHKETWWLKVMCCPGWDTGTERGHCVKTQEIRVMNSNE